MKAYSAPEVPELIVPRFERDVSLAVGRTAKVEQEDIETRISEYEG